jgi:hypothetical protein
MEINMTYAIIGAGTVGATLARFFAAKDIPVLIANSRGPETLGELAAEIGPSVTPVTVAEAVKADIILVAVGSLAFRARSWSRPSINCRSRSSPAHCPTMSVEGSYSSRATMRMRVRPSRLLRKALALRPSKSARLQKVAASSRHGHRSCSRI